MFPICNYNACHLLTYVTIYLYIVVNAQLKGVGIVEITDGGMSGRLVDVLRATNTFDNAPVGEIPGGTNYSGAERSDVHGAIVVSRK